MDRKQWAAFIAMALFLFLTLGSLALYRLVFNDSFIPATIFGIAFVISLIWWLKVLANDTTESFNKIVNEGDIRRHLIIIFIFAILSIALSIYFIITQPGNDYWIGHLIISVLGPIYLSITLWYKNRKG
jgi:hypothetical protein